MKSLLLILSFGFTLLCAQVLEKYAKDAQETIKQMQSDLQDYNQTLISALDKNETKTSFTKRQKLISDLNKNAQKLQQLTAKSISEDLQKSFTIGVYATYTCLTPNDDALCLDKALKDSSLQAEKDLLSDLHSYYKDNYGVADLNLSAQTQKVTVEKISKNSDPRGFNLYLNYEMNTTIHSDLLPKISKQTFLLDENLTTKDYTPKIQPTLLKEVVVAPFTYAKTLGSDPFPKPLALINNETLANEVRQEKADLTVLKSGDTHILQTGSKNDDKSARAQLMLLTSQNSSLRKEIEQEKKICTDANIQLIEAKKALTHLENRLNSANKSRGFYVDGTANFTHLFDQGYDYAGPRARVGYTLGNHSFGVSYESVNLLDQGNNIYDEFSIFGLDYMMRDGMFYANITVGSGSRRLQNRVDFFQEYAVPLYTSLDLFFRFGEIGFYFDLGIGVQYFKTDHQQLENSYYISALDYTLNKEAVGARAFLRIGLQ